MTEAQPSPVLRAGLLGEREQLVTFLDNFRAVFRAKVIGLSEADARYSPVPTGTSVGGLLKHLRYVEQAWFEGVIEGRTDLPPRPEREFVPAPEDTVASLLAEYDAQCETSRKIAAAHELTDTGTHRLAGEVTLRWVYLHMIQETARHAGHADIIREQIDGMTGPDI